MKFLKNPWAWFLTWIVLGTVLIAGPKDIVLVSETSQSDFFAPLSGAYALHQGLIIHKDFSSPMGVTDYLPFAWAMDIFGIGAKTVSWARAITFAFFASVTFLLLRPPRTNWLITTTAVVLISLMTSAPIAVGYAPTQINSGSIYNWAGIAWSGLCLLTISFAIVRSELLAPMILGLGLAWLTFLKWNFLAQALLFVGVGFLFSGLYYRIWAVPSVCMIVASWIVTTLSITLCYHISWHDMARDFSQGGACRSNWVLATLSQSDLGGNGSYYGLTSLWFLALKRLQIHQLELTLLTIGFVGSALGLSSRKALALLMVPVVVIAFDLLQSCLNSYCYALPLIPLLWLFLAIEVRNDEPKELNPGVFRTIPVLLATAYAVFFLGSHVYAFAINSGCIRSPYLVGGEIPTGLQIPSDGWHNLYFTIKPNGTNPPDIENFKIAAGISLLKTCSVQDKSVFVMDQVNPFPVVLQSPYPKGQPAWLHASATFDNQNHEEAAGIFRGCDVIMLPRRDFVNPWSFNLLCGLYGSYLSNVYSIAGQNDYWTLLTKTKVK